MDIAQRTERVIEAAGGGTKVAAVIAGKLAKKRFTRQAVNQWKREGIPPKWCPLLAELSGMQLYEIRPDVYPRPGAHVARVAAE